jgi:hypothetical protein
MWTREALAAKVEELGPGEALERFAAGLEPADRRRLQEVLIARSGMFEGTIRARLAAKGWVRRLWDSTARAPRR